MPKQALGFRRSSLPCLEHEQHCGHHWHGQEGEEVVTYHEDHEADGYYEDAAPQEELAEGSLFGHRPAETAGRNELDEAFRLHNIPDATDNVQRKLGGGPAVPL